MLWASSAASLETQFGVSGHGESLPLPVIPSSGLAVVAQPEIANAAAIDRQNKRNFEFISFLNTLWLNRIITVGFN